MIHSTGFFRAKTNSLIGLGQALVERYGGEVPGRLSDLVTLPGVGRKTANVVLGNAFGVPGITVDTHFGRLARRFGWTEQTDADKVEAEVGALFPKQRLDDAQPLADLARAATLSRRRPACGACPVAALCPAYGEGEIDAAKAAKLVKSGRRSRSRRDRTAGAGAAGPSGLVVALTLVACDRRRHGAGGRRRPGRRSGSAGPATRAAADVGGRCPTLSRRSPEDGLPGLELPCLGDGPSVNLADLRGVPTVLNVWAAWCTNCDREMPLFASAVDRAGDRVRFSASTTRRPATTGCAPRSTSGCRSRRCTTRTATWWCSGCGPPRRRRRCSSPPRGRWPGERSARSRSQAELDRLVQRYLGRTPVSDPSRCRRGCSRWRRQPCTCVPSS